MFRSVGDVARVWVFAARAGGGARVREPFVVVGGMQVILLLGLGFFHIPAFAGALAPVVRFLGGEAALHYPDHFWALPELYRDASTILALLITWFAWAVATMRFAGRFGAWSSAFRRAPAIAILAVFGSFGAWTLTSLFDLIPVEIALRSFVIRIGLQGIELGLIVALNAALAFALPALVLAGGNVSRALSTSVRMTGRMPLTMLVLYGVPAAVMFPLTFFLYEMDMGEAGLTPEAVGLLLTVRIAMQVVFDLLTIGGVTGLYLERTRKQA